MTNRRHSFYKAELLRFFTYALLPLCTHDSFTYLMESLSLVSAYFLDLLFGDPRWLPHPVRIIGWMIRCLEQVLRKGKGAKGYFLRLRGVVLTVIVVLGSAFGTYSLLQLCKRIHPVLGTVTWIFFAYTSIAVGDMFQHVRNISMKLKIRDIEGARQKLSFIVGRDTKDLSERGIITATIESIAESTNDGIIAPLLYLILGGPVLSIAYKAINTLDSMVGYKDEHYIHLGWFSARLDDAANFIPARITGLLVVISSFLLGENFKDSFEIMLKDGNKQPSPNSGMPEAAMAGALGIKLGGPSTYRGELIKKPYMGKEKHLVESLLINKAVNISFLSSILMVFIGAGIRWII